MPSYLSNATKHNIHFEEAGAVNLIDDIQETKVP